jgi:membrane associated rhomboid family serine protease
MNYACMARVRTVIYPLIFLNIFMFILQLILGNGFTDALALHKGDAFVRPWTLLTSMFLHDTQFFMHIVFNMYVLLMFGPLLEERIGPKRFLFAYFGLGLAASFFSSEIARACDFLPIPQNFCFGSAIGASGAIMGILGVIIMIMPDLKVVFMFVIPMPLWVAGIVIALVDLVGLFPGVASGAHLVGLAAGLIYGLSLRREKKTYSKKFKGKMHLDDDDVEEYLKSGRI